MGGVRTIESADPVLFESLSDLDSRGQGKPAGFYCGNNDSTNLFLIAEFNWYSSVLVL